MMSILQGTLQRMVRGRRTQSPREADVSPTTATVEVEDNDHQEQRQESGLSQESGPEVLNTRSNSRRRRRRALPDRCKEESGCTARWASASGETGEEGVADVVPPSPLSRDGMAVAVALADVIKADKESLLHSGSEQEGPLVVTPRRIMGDSCPICYDVMEDPVYLGCTCRAVFCRPCIERVHSKGMTEIGARRLCPLCRGRSQTVASVKHLEAAGEQTRALAKKLLRLLGEAQREGDATARHSLLVQSALVLVTLACEARSHVETDANNNKEDHHCCHSNNHNHLDDTTTSSNNNNNDSN